MFTTYILFIFFIISYFCLFLTFFDLLLLNTFHDIFSLALKTTAILENDNEYTRT